MHTAFPLCSIFSLNLCLPDRRTVLIQRPVDYAFRYREDQDILIKDEIEAMASKDGVATADWKEAETAVLARNGNQQDHGRQREIPL